VNLRQMECFRAMMTTGTETRAADLLGVSQPAVSAMIQQLEREVGFSLFARRGGRLRPTAEAKYLFDDVQRTLGSLDRTRQTARAIRARTQGHLVIASYPGIAIDFLPKLLTRFLADRPQVRVELQSRSTHVIHELIPAQPFDLAVADLPADRRGVDTEPLTLDCVCVVPAGHALAALPEIGPESLSGVPFIALFREHVIHYRLARAFVAAASTWNVVAETRFFASNCAFVAYGAGVSVVDPITAAEYAGRGVVARPFRPRIAYDIGLLYPSERPRSLLLETFVGELRGALAPYLAAAATGAASSDPAGGA